MNASNRCITAFLAASVAICSANAARSEDKAPDASPFPPSGLRGGVPYEERAQRNTADGTPNGFPSSSVYRSPQPAARTDPAAAGTLVYVSFKILGPLAILTLPVVVPLAVVVAVASGVNNSLVDGAQGKGGSK